MSISSIHSSVRLRRIRVRKEDSAYVYAILESHEGIASYSTLPNQPREAHRDLELQVPEGFTNEVEELFVQLGDMIYDLDRSSK